MFNISYEIKLHDTCGNIFSKTIKLNEIFRKTGIPSGDYFMEIIPRIETAFCKDQQCPVFVNQNGIFENEVKCEDCKKMVKFIQIKDNFEFQMKIFETFEVKANDEILLVDSSLLNQTLLLNENIRIIIPSILKSNQLCNNTLEYFCPKETKYSFFIIIFLLSVIILLSIALLYFGCSKYSK